MSALTQTHERRSLAPAVGASGHFDEQAIFAYLGRLRILAKRVSVSMRREFIHDEKTCGQWSHILRKLRAAAGWGMSDDAPNLRGTEYDLRLKVFRELITGALACLDPTSLGNKLRDGGSVVAALKDSQEYVHGGYTVINTLQIVVQSGSSVLAKAPIAGTAPLPVPADVNLEQFPEDDRHEIQEVREKLVVALREFQYREQLASMPAPPGSSPSEVAANAVKPYLALCTAGREAFFAEFLVLALFPRHWDWPVHAELYRLHHRAAAAMPAGPIRDAAVYRAARIRKYFPAEKGPGQLDAYLRIALKPSPRESIPAGEGSAAGATVPQDDADQSADMRLSPVVNLACAALDSWKFFNADASQVTHPLSQHLQLLKGQILTGAKPKAAPIAKLVEACRVTFTAVVAAHDSRWRKSEGIVVPADFARRLSEYLELTKADVTLRLRPGELLAVLVVLFQWAMPDDLIRKPKPVCAGLLVKGGRLKLKFDRCGGTRPVNPEFAAALKRLESAGLLAEPRRVGGIEKLCRVTLSLPVAG